MKHQLKYLPLLLISGYASAQSLIVDWGGDYVTGNQSTNLADSTTTGEFGGDAGSLPNDTLKSKFSLDTTPVNPTIGANYSGTSAVFYGASEAINFDGDGTNMGPGIQVTENAAGDRLNFFSFGFSGGEVDRTTNIILFRDFIGGGSYTVGDLSSASINAAGFNEGLRWAIQADGNYYLSSAFSPLSTTVTLPSFTDSNQWGLYDPTDNGTLFAETVTLDQTLTGTESVTAFGLYQTRANKGGFIIDSFEVSAIPEPNAFGLIFGLTALGLVSRRRRV